MGCGSSLDGLRLEFGRAAARVWTGCCLRHQGFRVELQQIAVRIAMRSASRFRGSNTKAQKPTVPGRWPQISVAWFPEVGSGSREYWHPWGAEVFPAKSGPLLAHSRPWAPDGTLTRLAGGGGSRIAVSNGASPRVGTHALRAATDPDRKPLSLNPSGRRTPSLALRTPRNVGSAFSLERDPVAGYRRQ